MKEKLPLLFFILHHQSLFLIVMKRHLPIFLFILISLFACRKDSFITSPAARLTTSTDTLHFDTVFVTAGSTYRTLKIFNPHNQKLLLSSLTLMGGASAVFKMNVDGVVGYSFTNIEINANDSILAFVQVNINPSAASLPFVVRDSIELKYNGNTQKIQLEAWGQNAHFFRNKVISTNETWANDKPYVILGSLLVNANQTLTINKGCRIFMHADAPIIINGSLQVNGLKDSLDRVYFQGDRLDAPYNEYPASWPGIFFLPAAKDNVLHYAVIKNAYQGIGLQSPATNANPKLMLNECIIDNAYDAGILAEHSSIQARNTLISNCGKNLLLTQGGDYQFNHCTLVTYGNRFIDHKNPVLQLSNNANGLSNNLNATFRNCIFWGENGLVADEVVVEKTGNAPFAVLFDYNLWKVQTAPANCTTNQIINNQTPLFDSINTAANYYNFRLQNISPAINKGTITSLTTDLDGRTRTATMPDLGCFEKQ
jgi:hypothetical protein